MNRNRPREKSRVHRLYGSVHEHETCSPFFQGASAWARFDLGPEEVPLPESESDQESDQDQDQGSHTIEVGPKRRQRRIWVPNPEFDRHTRSRATMASQGAMRTALQAYWAMIAAAKVNTNHPATLKEALNFRGCTKVEGRYTCRIHATQG